MCDFAERYLRTNMRVNLANATLGTTPVQVLPSNPMRHAIAMPYGGTTVITYQFGDQQSGLTVNGYLGNPPQIIISRDDIGDIITFPIRMFLASGALTARFEEYVYDPNHFAWYQRRLDEFLAHSGS